MIGTIATTKSGRINITETVYETAKGMKGTFSIDNLKWAINCQLDEEEQLTRKQVQGALNNFSKYQGQLKKVNAYWYSFS